jgi:hypothetical protein
MARSRELPDLKTFLKQTTAIPNVFIDTFLTMYDPETTQTDMVIEADRAATWLGINKFTLLKTLRCSYRDGLDFKVNVTKKSRKSPRSVNSARYGGNNFKHVLMTPDCFKRICMRSRSLRAEEVRTYFIELEALIVRYRAVLQKGMEAEIRSMERQLKPSSRADHAGYIYVIRASAEKDSLVKIGQTKDLAKRLSNYSTGAADGVEVLYKFRTNSHISTERCLKALLKEHQYRKRKEVYQADVDMIKQLIKGCDAMTQYKQLYASRKKHQMTGGYYLVLQPDST